MGNSAAAPDRKRPRAPSTDALSWMPLFRLANVPVDTADYVSGAISLSILQHPTNNGIVFVWGEVHTTSTNCACACLPNCPSVVQFISRSTGPSVVLGEIIGRDARGKSIGNTLADICDQWCADRAKKAVQRINAPCGSITSFFIGGREGHVWFFNVDPRYCLSPSEEDPLMAPVAKRVRALHARAPLAPGARPFFSRPGPRSAPDTTISGPLFSDVVALGVRIITQCEQLKVADVHPRAEDVRRCLQYLYANMAEIGKTDYADLWEALFNPDTPEPLVYVILLMYLLDCALFLGIQRWADSSRTTHIVCGGNHTPGVVALATLHGYRVLMDRKYEDYNPSMQSCLDLHTLRFGPSHKRRRWR